MKHKKGVAGRIMRKVRGRPAAQRTWTPRDFEDLGSRDAVDQALGRLVKAGKLRRIGRGLYDAPRWSPILRGPAPVDLDAAIAALARRDGVRIVAEGSVAANQLGLTNAVPARLRYLTDGTSRTLRIGSQTIRLRHAAPRKMRWSDRPAGAVVRALQWLGPDSASNPGVVLALQDRLPDAVKRNLIQERQYLPGWMIPIAQRIAGESVARR